MEDWEMMIVNKNIGDMTKSELKDFIIELQEENSKYERINKKYKEVIDNIKYYLEDSANQMSEDSTYTLMDFIREVE